MRGPHILMVLASLCLVGLGVFLFVHEAPKTKAHKMAKVIVETKGQPTMGQSSARAHMVIFEEPNCSHCEHYNNHIFPKIREAFIDKGSLLYTSIPVSFLPHSMLTAQAWLSVYHQGGNSNSDLFFAYLDAYYSAKEKSSKGHKKSPLWDKAKLIALAKETSPRIDLKALENHLDKGDFEKAVKDNTDLGDKAMDGGLMTPAIFIDGVYVKEVSFSSIEKAIKSALEKKQTK